MNKPVNTVQIVDTASFPAQMQPGVLYMSDEFGTAGHLCCCGCGHRVVTPLGPGRWTLTRTPSNQPTLSPSVGNTSLACRSHYLIQAGAVRWVTQMTDEQHHAAMAADRRALQEALPTPATIWSRIIGRVKQLLRIDRRR